MEPINILMVDDQPGKLLTYESMLDQMGETLIKAQTAREALAHLLKEDIAVVLMDVNMPELDGFELAAMIREHPRCKRTAIIFVSAVHLTDVDRVRGYATGAVDYVSVPVVPEILRAKVGVFADLYRKSTELERLNRTLEDRVAARTAELEQTIGQLREQEQRLRVQGDALAEADLRKTEFLAMLAHELRNPLQPIRMSVELLREPGRNPEHAKWAHDVIDRQVDHLVRLVDDLLDAGRISSGKLELRMGRIDLRPVILGAVDSNRPTAERARHRVDVTLPPTPVHVDGDAVRLTQVFLNLLNNAVKYSPEGTRTRIDVEVHDAEVVARVKDEGVGIAPSDLPRVFDMFFQADAGASDAQGGLGLGLALVRQLVELHGGRVEARSAGPGRGSEFIVHLPTRATPIAAGDPAPPSERARVAPRRVLVVDDNRDAAESIALLLQFEGNEVEVEFDGESALAAIATFRPDVVLMDIGMPKLDGHAAARTIRQASGGADVLLIALTGWGGDEDRARSRQAGFDHHLVKPVVAEELLGLVSSLARPVPDAACAGGRPAA